MSHKLTGIVKAVGETQTVGAKGFRKRELIVTTSRDIEDKYPQHIKLQFVQDNVDKLDGINPGDTVTVQFDLRGSEHNGRFYTDLQGWRIDRDAAAPAQTAAATTAPDSDEISF